jgi:hypothetical protein
MRTIKALTVWQPWASLLVAGIKEYETRPWETQYRGWLAIHAAKSTAGRTMAEEGVPIKQCIGRAGFAGFNDMPRGCVLGIVYLDLVVPTKGFQTSTFLEMMLGNFAWGRFAWHIVPEMRAVFDDPIPARGRQGLWNWDMPDSVKLLKGRL